MRLPAFKSMTVLAGLAAYTGTAAAAPVGHLAWNACQGPLVRVITPDDAAVTVFVTVSGVDFAHQGFAASFAFAGDDPFLCRPAAEGRLEPPDAWRFDVVGCQGPDRARFDFASPGAVGCAWIGGDPATATTGRHVDPAPSYMPEEWIRFLGVATYPVRPAPMPGQTFFLFAVTLNLGRAKAGATTPFLCGGLERPLYVTDSWSELTDALGCTIRPLQATITDATGTALAIEPGPSRLTVDTTALPATNSTWGQIKAQYR